MEAIIFDVDGTLWDSTDEVALSWNHVTEEILHREGKLTGKLLEPEFGKPLPEIINNVFPELTKEEQEEFAAKLFTHQNKAMETAPCKLYEGLEQTIKDLSSLYKLFIVSNCQAGYIEAFLKNTGLGLYITDFTCPGDTGVLKADNIRLIMDRNGIKDAVYVGDTQGDADACREAGVPMIYAAYGFGEVENTWVEIQSLGELLDLHRKNVI